MCAYWKRRNMADQEKDQHDQNCAWALELEQHLKEFQPELYKGLKANGSLKTYCQSQAASAHRMSQHLTEQGASRFEAQEAAKRQYIYPSMGTDSL
jgi:hypothetical protein